MENLVNDFCLRLYYHNISSLLEDGLDSLSLYHGGEKSQTTLEKNHCVNFGKLNDKQFLMEILPVEKKENWMFSHEEKVQSVN